MISKIISITMLLPFTTLALLAQTAPQSILKNGKNTQEIQLTKEILELHTAGSNTVLLQNNSSTPPNRKSVSILNANAEKVFSKYYLWINSISISNSGNEILIAHKRQKNADEPYYVEHHDADIIDSLGNSISGLTDLSTPYLKISSNGKFAITTRQYGPDEKGHFQIFDLQEGSEISLNKKYRYSIFLADFLGKDKIVIIMQPPMQFERDPSTGKRINERYPTCKLVIYNLVTKSIITEKNLFSNNNENIWIGFHNGILITSGKGNYLSLAANAISPAQFFPHKPSYIMVIDEDGNIINEINIPKKNMRISGIKNMVFLKDSLILVEKFGMNMSKLYLFDCISMKAKWEYNLGYKETIGMSNSFTLNERLIINSAKGVYEFGFDSGTLINKDINIKQLIMNRNKNLLMIKNNSLSELKY